LVVNPELPQDARSTKYKKKSLLPINIASYIGVEGEHYGDHCQHSRVQYASVYAIHTPEIVLLPSHYTLAATRLMSLLVTSAQT
jgi:hypothetical protein